jgi:hypothetical protein
VREAVLLREMGPHGARVAHERAAVDDHRNAAFSAARRLA